MSALSGSCQDPFMGPRERLETLAQLHAVELAYHDISGTLHVASNDNLVRILGNLGVRADTEEDVEDALRSRRLELARRVLEPVVVFWEGQPPVFVLRVPVAKLPGRYRVELRFEQGTALNLQGELSTLRIIETFEVEGEIYVDLEMRVTERLPFGYHRLQVDVGDEAHEALALSAPMTAYVPEEDRMWGLFAPTYALHGRRTLGAGGFAELAHLVDVTQMAGGHVVATLPLMAAFLDELFQPSPYVPVSKLFWNELFLDLHQLARAQGSEAARIALADPELLDEAERLREAPLVDYFAQARLHRTVLEILAREAYDSSVTRAEIETFAMRHPRAADYARFRAVTEGRRSAWPTWPDRLRDGHLEPGDYDEASFRYHLYGQWRAEQQLSELAARARAAGGGLYLDLPLGVHPDGYDAWRDRDVFLQGVNAGAPPDALGPEGQDWGFRPLHPERLRQTRYRYLIETLRTQVRHSGILRIDHVMGLHRIFCVPWGLGGQHGVYVRYRPEEIWAIVCLESRRHGAMIVGEDLGTVPDEVRATMSQHDVQRMFVLQFEIEADRRNAIHDIPKNAVASVNTHDTPTFAGFWEAHDIADRERLGRMDGGSANGARAERHRFKGALAGFLEDRALVNGSPSAAEIYRAAILHLAASPSRLVLLNIEDLWLEPEPQNVPGTSDERPNWRRKMRPSLDVLGDMPAVRVTLAEVAAARSAGSPPGAEDRLPASTYP